VKKLFLSILVICSLLGGNAYAFCIFFCDPDVEGCVYSQDTGQKIECIGGISYNEAKDPGSLNRAENFCLSYLRESAYDSGVSNYSIEGCYDMNASPYN
jgi:hypothetical protein